MQTIEEKGTKVFQLRADTCTCGVCFYQCSDVISLIVHKTQHAIAENVYKCELCSCLHSGQEALCNHYLIDHKVVMLFTKTEVLAGDLVEISEDQATELHSQTIAVLDTEDRSIQQLELVDGNDRTDLKSKSSSLFNSEEVKAVHIEVTQEPEADIPQPCDTPLHLSAEVETISGSFVSVEESAKAKTTKTLVDKNQFLLVTECSASCSRPYLKTWFLCLFCAYSTITRAAFLKHMKNVHKKSKGAIPIIENDVVERSGVQYGKAEDVTFGWNLMTMDDYDQFVPVLASKDDNSSKLSKKCVRRLEKQDILGNFPCKSCSKVFSRMRYLRRHLATHNDEKPHICKECNRGFKRAEHLRVHKKTCLKPSKQYECPQCDFKSKINTVIHAHRQLHPDGCILCDVCGKAYADKSTLMKHMQVHDPSRPFACTITGCMWRFKSEVMFRAHLRAHSTKGKFLCSYCGYAFRTAFSHKHHLLRHQSSMHGIEPPKPRPYGQMMKEVAERDMVEIPADQLEIHETAFLDQPIFMTGEPDAIISEPTDLSSINNLIQTHVVCKEDGSIVFEHKQTES